MRKIVVALTSYPKRIALVGKVIESLWTQTVCADEIMLYLNDKEFPGREREFPETLTGMIGKNGFQVKWVDDNLKSHKKYFYALQEKRNDIVITADDDVIYAETFIDDLLRSYRRFPNAVSARSARIILREGEMPAGYREWEICPDEYADMPRMDLCAIGYAGVLYPPFCANDKWFDREKIKVMAEEQDDLWLKYNEIIGGIPVVYVKPGQKDILVEEAEETALCTANVCGGKNDASIAKLSAWMKKSHMEIYRKWISTLIPRQEYLGIKQKANRERLEKLLDGLGDMPVYLYGAGKKAGRILEELSRHGLADRIAAVVVSEKKGNPDRLGTLEVKQIDEISGKGIFAVIYGIGAGYKKEVNAILEDCSCVCLDLDIG